MIKHYNELNQNYRHTERIYKGKEPDIFGMYFKGNRLIRITSGKNIYVSAFPYILFDFWGNNFSSAYVFAFEGTFEISYATKEGKLSHSIIRRTFFYPSLKFNAQTSFEFPAVHEKYNLEKYMNQ